MLKITTSELSKKGIYPRIIANKTINEEVFETHLSRAEKITIEYKNFDSEDTITLSAMVGYKIREDGSFSYNLFRFDFSKGNYIYNFKNKQFEKYEAWSMLEEEKENWIVERSEKAMEFEVFVMEQLKALEFKKIL